MTHFGLAKKAWEEERPPRSRSEVSATTIERRFLSLLGLASMALSTILPSVAAAQFSTCHGSVAILISPQELPIGQKATITLALRTGSIENGSQIRISRVRYDLDCNANFPLGIPCTDQGDIFSYQGNINTTCGVNWTANVPAGNTAINEVVFTASPALVQDPFGAECFLSFDVKAENLEPTIGLSSDSTPLVTEVVTGYSTALRCYGGSNNLGTCSSSTDCPDTSGTCFGGTNAGNACSSNADCVGTGTPGSCVGSCVADAVCDNALALGVSESDSIALVVPTPTPTPPPTNTPPPVPVVPTPTSPAGLLLIGGLGVSIAWMLSRIMRRWPARQHGA
jgi:hypothetical protein